MTRTIKSRKDLNDSERLHLFFLLVKDFDGKKLLHGSIKKHANLFSVSRRTVSRIWELGSKSIDNGDVVDVTKKLSKHVGRKRLQIDMEIVKQIPLRRRKTIASLAHALEIPKSVVHRRVKEGLIRRNSNAIKPQLTDENKKARLRFCLSMIQEQFSGKQDVLGGLNLVDVDTAIQSDSLGVEQLFNNLASKFAHLSIDCTGSEFKFVDMFDRVIIDEKWFYMSKESEKYYLTADETEPYRSCQSKKFIPKIMFLAAVARPRFNELEEVIFDGKIGIFPFTYQEQAKRKSKNRAAGTLETKPIVAVTQDVSRSWLIEKVLPAIRDKWPTGNRRSTIFIQQDNARPHIKPFDEKFLEAAKIDGFDIQLTCQPPNSPELNVLDLGYFRAIQALQYQESPRTIDELVAAVEKSYNDLSPKALNRVFLTLQECMIEVMKSGGGNNFKIPHMRKGKLEKEGLLPLSLKCNYEILQQATNYLQT